MILLTKLAKKFAALQAKHWQNLISLLVCLSFIDAHLHKGPGFELWSSSPEGLLIFLTVGVGMKMTKDVITNTMQMKYNAGSATVDNPDRKDQ